MNQGRRGVAMITALLLAIFLLVLGLAFLTFTEQDYRFAGQQNNSTEAYYLAVSGVEYYRARPATFTTGTAQVFSMPPGDPHDRFEVTVEADGTVRSRGFLVNSSGDTVSERTLVAPQGDFSKLYDASQ